MKKAYSRGFTAVELLVAVILAICVIGGGITFAGRHVVDDSDAVKTAAKEGILEGKVIDRHDWLSTRHGCAYSDADSFVVEGKLLDGKPVKATVCCRSWFKGCSMGKK